MLMLTSRLVRHALSILFVAGGLVAIANRPGSASDYCYMRTAEGRYISLNDLCGESAQPIPSRPLAPPPPAAPDSAAEPATGTVRVEITIDETVGDETDEASTEATPIAAPEPESEMSNPVESRSFPEANPQPRGESPDSAASDPEASAPEASNLEAPDPEASSTLDEDDLDESSTLD